MTQTVQDQNQILNSLPDYPYEWFFNENDDDEYCCLVGDCTEVFDTYEAYLEHFLYNRNHLNYIKRNLMRYNPREDLGEEIVWDPLEKLQIEDNIKNDPKYAALKYNRDATQHLIDKIDFAVKHNRNIIAISIGVPGAGKSYATYAVAMMTSGKFGEKLGKVTQVDLEFTQADFLEAVTKTVDCEGNSVIQDEDPRGFGSGQLTNEGAFENLGKTVRKKNLNIFIVSPIMPKLKNVGFVIEWFAYYPKTRIAKGVLYTRKRLALGYIYVEILPSEDYIIYEERKDAFLDNMIASGGFGIDNYSDERYQRDFNDLLQNVLLTDPEMKKTRILSKAYRYARGDTKYQAMIAEDVYFELKENKPKGKQKGERGKVGLGELKFDWELLDTIEDPQIGDFIYKHSQPRTREQKLGHAWWKYYFCTADAKGEQASDFINEEFNEDVTKMAYYNTFFPKFRSDYECFGRAVEYAIHERYYPTYEIDAGQGKPDLIGKSDFIEVKARKNGTTRDILGYFTNKDKDKDRSYIWELLKQGEDVKLVEVVYAPKQKFTINVYRLYIDKSERSDESAK